MPPLPPTQRPLNAGNMMQHMPQHHHAQQSSLVRPQSSRPPPPPSSQQHHHQQHNQQQPQQPPPPPPPQQQQQQQQQQHQQSQQHQQQPQHQHTQHQQQSKHQQQSQPQSQPQQQQPQPQPPQYQHPHPQHSHQHPHPHPHPHPQVLQQQAPMRIDIFIGNRDGRTYRLSVEQQPVRARMCGFGDKDRRPITPPPCVRLIVCDSKTGKEIEPNDVDSTFFVLMVDLWSEDSLRAVNLVRHSSAAPTISISSSTTTAYPPPPERSMYMAATLPQYVGYSQPMPPRPANPYAPPPAHASYYPPGPVTANYPVYASSSPYENPTQTTGSVAMPSTIQNHTRNLIGMNAVNACRLNDPDGNAGFWFVLQDLSVRTEGTFRLKLSMCDIGVGQGPNAVVSTGKCPILASTFSEPFTVYSAKKFPGVIESTPLSKCFAGQGIKIPIRKDGVKERSNQIEYDNDD